MMFRAFWIRARRVAANYSPMLTARLELRSITAGLCAIPAEDGGALARALGVEVAADWPPEHLDADALQWCARKLREQPEAADWLMKFVILRPSAERATPLVVGTVGYKGPPDASGTVEVGYSIVSTHQRCGYASEAVRALLKLAFADPRVTRVIAETYPELVPSLRVMEKSGLTFAGPGTEPRIVQYELPRARWAARGETGAKS